MTFSATDGQPVLVEVTRGPLAESVHRVRAVAVRADGRVLFARGDVAAPVYPRSAIKSVQALPLVETGAADALGVTSEELALASASHGGEPAHTGRVAAWLARIGLAPGDLECGTHAPYHAETAAELVRRGEAPGPVHNNCSGKHTGFLSTALHMGEPTRGYVGYDHPVQRRLRAVAGAMADLDLDGAPWGVDGCSIPTLGMPLRALALCMARMADPSGLPSARAEAAARIVAAWGAHPHLISGTATFDTDFMTGVGSRILTKAGAEGVCCAVVPGAGIGLAVKVEDGTTRAAGPAAAAVLRTLGLIGEADWNRLGPVVEPPVRTRQGAIAGHVRCCG